MHVWDKMRKYDDKTETKALCCKDSEARIA